MEENQTREQAGFRSGFTTINHIYTISQLREKCKIYNLPLCLAFDSVKIFTILKSPSGQGINKAYVQLMMDIYTGCSSTARLGDSTMNMSINTGVRQGDTISPQLFTVFLEQIFKNMDWEECRIKIGGEKIIHLKFADDIILISESPHEAK